MNRPLLYWLMLTAAISFAEEPAVRYPAVLQSAYSGTHPDLYAEQQDRVRILVRQAQLEVSSQLGLLLYQEGFRNPLTVRFDDAPVRGLEYALAYVRPMISRSGFAQELVINLDVMAHGTNDFDMIFYHEMTHAVLNDAVTSVYGQGLPSWVQEGLAVYIAGDGMKRVRALAQNYKKSQVKIAVRDLELPVLDYTRNYMAFKYMVDKQSINTLQTFVRDLTQGKSTEESVEDSTGKSWNAFRQAVKDYTLEIYQQEALPDF